MQDSAGRDINVENLFSADRQNGHGVIMDLLRYWESLRAGRIAPVRSEIDPRMIKSALKHTFILELDPIGGIRFRLAGDKVCAVMGMELRGMPASTLIDIPDRQKFEQTLHSIVRSPEIIEYRLAAGRESRFEGSARMLLLPMQDADGKITRVLGGLSMRTQLFDPPLRFEVVEKMTTRIVACAGQKVPAGESGFAEAQAAFAPKQQTPAGSLSGTAIGADRRPVPVIPHLQIVSDNFGQTRR